MTEPKDPFGRQPLPVTGSLRPDFSDLSLRFRHSEAKKGGKAIWVDHDPQKDAIEELHAYRLETLDRTPGVALDGRRLSQETQAGKSALAWRFKEELAEERRAAGLADNPYQVIIITIGKRMTLKDFYREILKQMKDDFLEPEVDGDSPRTKPLKNQQREDRRSYSVLEQRIAEWVVRLGVEVIIADEAQRLDRASDDASDVTERIQTFLDRGVVPLVLIGNGKSQEFFAKNPNLCARLGKPIELRRLDPDNSAQDAKDFKKFCTNFDKAMVDSGLIACLSNLDSEKNLEALQTVSDGHIGRVARLLQEALPHAVRRGAASVEAYDLSVATRGYAISNGWTKVDPFSA